MDRIFPDLHSPEDDIYRCFVDEAITDPRIQEKFGTIFEWDNTQDWPINQFPSEARLPAIVFEVPTIGAEPESNVEHVFTMQIDIKLFIPGYHLADVFGAHHLLWQMFLSKSFRNKLATAADRVSAAPEQLIQSGFVKASMPQHTQSTSSVIIQYRKQPVRDIGG